MEWVWLVVGLLVIPAVGAPTSQPPTTAQVFNVSQGTGRAFLWSSIALAVLTALIQGLVTALALMTESSNYWTFRFRLAKIEHWWWTLVSLLLLTSLVLIILSFLTGNNGEAVSILALSTATFLTIVQYALPAWRSRGFISNRWLAWTGDSRTSIPNDKAGFCGPASKWRQMVGEVDMRDVKKTPSDWYGLRLWPVKGIPQDPTEMLRNVSSQQTNPIPVGDSDRNRDIYDDGDPEPKNLSLRWGTAQGFRKRVSRATASMPSGLLQSRPFTTDGYAGEGLCLAMGILGRNKGVNPKQLVFRMNRDISTAMESQSTWYPRPYKVLRSYYMVTLQNQYSYLGPDFVAAAVELALLLMDVRRKAVAAWLEEGLEHQLLQNNKDIAKLSLNREAELQAHYESSYVSMIFSLNNMDKRMKYHSASRKFLNRPDLICTGLLLKAREEPEPHWWNNTHLKEVRINQMRALTSESDWKEPMAQLLGLPEWPRGFDENPSIWDFPAPTEKPPEEKGSVVGSSMQPDSTEKPCGPEPKLFDGQASYSRASTAIGSTGHHHQSSTSSQPLLSSRSTFSGMDTVFGPPTRANTMPAAGPLFEE